MLKLSKSIAVAVSSAIALGAATLSAHASDLDGIKVIKAGDAALYSLGSKKVAATYLAKDGLCDVTLWIANLPDADGYVTGMPTRISAPINTGSQTRVYVSEGHALEASCSISAKVLTLRPIALTAAAQ